MAPADGGVPLLLARALRWTDGRVDAAAATPLDTPSPCEGWDLAALLAHLVDGLDTLAEACAVDVGTSRPGARGRSPTDPTHGCSGPDLCRRAHAAADSVRVGWQRPRSSVRVAGTEVPADVVAAVGALEVAVHGHDLARTTGEAARLPSDLAAALVPVAVRHVVADPGAREGRFGPALRQGSDPTSVLLGLLGRAV